MRKFIVLMFLIVFPFVAFGSEVNEGLAVLLNVVAPFIATYAVKFPWIATVLKVLLYSRIIIKPLMSAALEVADQLPEGKYRKFMKDMSGHWAYKTFAYLLDWFVSIKLPKK